MDEWLKQLEQLTFQCVRSMANIQIEDMEHFIEQRGQMILKLQKFELNEAEKAKHKQAIDRILQYDPMIVAKMNELKAEAAAGLNKVTAARRQKSAYEAAYISDSYYFDKKK